MATDVPKQLDAEFTHHGMQVDYRARAPREARVLAIAMFMGMVLPMIPGSRPACSKPGSGGKAPCKRIRSSVQNVESSEF